MHGNVDLSACGGQWCRKDRCVSLACHLVIRLIQLERVQLVECSGAGEKPGIPLVSVELGTLESPNSTRQDMMENDAKTGAERNGTERSVAGGGAFAPKWRRSILHGVHAWLPHNQSRVRVFPTPIAYSGILGV